eukprot:gene9853-13255_t
MNLQLGNSKRLSDEEAKEVLGKIESLKGLLSAAPQHSIKSNDPIGFMYLSRFNKNHTTSSTEAAQMSDDSSNRSKEYNGKMKDFSESDATLGAKTNEFAGGAHPKNHEKNRLYSLSLATLAMKPEKRLSIVNEGAISALIMLSNVHDQTVQVRVASAFSSLAKEPSIRSRMIDEGAVMAIINLTNSSNVREAKMDGARAICNLCCEVGYEYKMIKDAVPFATTHIAAACPECYDICLKTLLNISSVNEKLGRIEDVTEALILFFNCPLTSDQEYLLLAAFCNLSAIRNNQLRMVEDGIMKVVEKYVASTQDKLRRMSCEILKHLTSDSRSRIKLLELNVITTLLSMLNDDLYDIRVSCMKAILFLSKDFQFRSRLAQRNAMTLIIQHCMSIRTDEIEMGQIVVKTLRLLCADKNLSFLLVRDGIGNALEYLIQVNDNIINQYCAESLCLLYQIPEVLHELIHQGTIRFLLKLASNTIMSDNTGASDQSVGSDNNSDYYSDINSIGNQEETDNFNAELNNTKYGKDNVNQDKKGFIFNPITAEWCSIALFYLTRSSQCSSETIQTYVLPSIISICSANATQRAKTYCSAGIMNITKLYSSRIPVPLIQTKPKHPEKRGSKEISNSYLNTNTYKDIDVSSAISLLIDMLRSETDQIIKQNCAVSLFNLADKDSNCYLMLNNNALMPTIQLTQSDNMKTKVICAGIISRLSLHEQYYYQFAEGDVLKVLLELSCVDHRLTQRRVVIALSNLSHNENLRTKLLLLNPIPYIISLASERDEYLRRGCMSIVCNMSYLPGSERAIVNAGIIPTLLITSLITSDQLISKLICVKAIVNLMADTTLYKSMVSDGLIWGLSKLSELHNEELLVLCAKALLSLSCDYAKEIIASKIAIRTVIHLLNYNDLSIKKIGGRILTNLLLQTTNNDESFRKYIVNNMMQLVVTKDHELNEMSVLCLCLTSQSESCRSAIVVSGMLKLIDTGSTIFNDKRISYAYLSMIINIANNPGMRSLVLDAYIISRFEKISLVKDYSLDLAIAKAIYCISCSKENVHKLIEQNILEFIQVLSENEYDMSAVALEMTNNQNNNNNNNNEYGKNYNKPKEIAIHLISCIYNLTTVIETQNKLVSQNVVEVLINLVSTIRPITNNTNINDINIEKILKLAYLSICHLACGKTNTTRMVADGCTTLITTIFQFSYSIDLFVRCSASIRNLLCIVSNQSIMIQHGIIDIITEIANKFDSTLNKINSSDLIIAQDIRLNCAASLKSLTYNKDLRHVLLNSSAINIILAELIDESDGLSTINHGLLRELEAESWDNGVRGKRHGRAKALSPASLYLDLLKGVSNIQLNVALKHDTLQKFNVQVQLDEDPVIELQEDFPMTSTGTAGDANNTIITEENGHNHNNKPAGVNGEIMYGKQECELSHEPIINNSNYISNYDKNEQAVSYSFDDNEDSVEIMNITKTFGKSFAFVENISPNDDNNKESDKYNNNNNNNNNNSPKSKSIHFLPKMNNNNQEIIPINNNNHNNNSNNNKKNDLKNNKYSHSKSLPNIPGVINIPSHLMNGGISSSSMSQKMNETNKSKKSKDEDIMKNLVDLIRSTKNEKNGKIENVIQKWHELSRF